MIRRAVSAALLLAACTPVPRPAALEEADRTRQAAASKEAAALAPQEALHADKLRADADAAFRAGDRAGAQILAEQALAAYAHAVVLARGAKADARMAKATVRLDEARAALAAQTELQSHVAAEADDLEMRGRVLRDALPVAPSEPASADREHARWLAARALAAEARLLCVATQMLAPDTDALKAAYASLDTLDKELAKPPAQTPIDEAVRLRSVCLAELTAARHGPTSAAPEAGAADALLDELGRAGQEPSRDDRGVTVVLRDVFQGSALKPSARERLTALGQVARAHAAFPVLVVVHGARGPATPHDVERADAVGKALVEAGAPRVTGKAAGDALPVAPPRQVTAAARNERVEIVFVSPAQ
jgi:hypothetical protein